MKVWVLVLDEHIPEDCPTFAGVYSNIENAKNACGTKKGEVVEWYDVEAGIVEGELFSISPKRHQKRFLATYRITEVALDAQWLREKASEVESDVK